MFAGNWLHLLERLAGNIRSIRFGASLSKSSSTSSYLSSRSSRIAAAHAGEVGLFSYCPSDQPFLWPPPGDWLQQSWTNSFVQFNSSLQEHCFRSTSKGAYRSGTWLFRFVGVAVAITCWLIAYYIWRPRRISPRATVPSAHRLAPGTSRTVLLFLSLLGTPAKYLPILSSISAVSPITFI